MKKLIFSLLLWAFLIPAYATDYVFSDCGTGAAGGCVAGSDGAAGTISAPFQTLAKATTIAGTAVAGDRFLFCKGAAWNNWTFSTIPTTSTFAAMKANPIVFDSVACSTFTSSAKPLMNNRTKKLDNTTDCNFGDFPNPCHAFEFSIVSGSTQRGGIVVQNLEFKGNNTAPAQGGGVVRGKVSNVLWSGNTISNMSYTGLYCQSNGTFNPTSYINYVSNTISSIGQFAMAGFNGCDHQYIAYNTCDFCANAAVTAGTGALYHPVYVSGCDWTPTDTCQSKGTVIRGNTFTNSCTNRTDINSTFSACAVIVGHDRIDGWIIENNSIITATGKSDPRNWCIQYEPGNGPTPVEYEKRIIIRGNRCVNPGNTGILIGSAANAVIETNDIVQLNVFDNYYAISQVVSNSAGGITNSTNTIQANSIFIEGATDTTAGIRFNGGGTGHVVINNLIRYGATGPGSFGYCYETDIASSGFATWDYNLCYNAVRWSVTYANKAAWTSARSPQETNSLSSDPLLVATPASGNNYSMQIQSGSPAKNAASTGCATVTSACRLSIDGYVRTTSDIGAWEQGVNP